MCVDIVLRMLETLCAGAYAITSDGTIVVREDAYPSVSGMLRSHVHCSCCVSAPLLRTFWRSDGHVFVVKISDDLADVGHH
jgi:hypothetical protein